MSNWLAQHVIYSYTLLFYSRKLVAHCLHARQLLVELLGNGIRTMSRMSSFCVHIHHIRDESISHKHLFAVEIGERERARAFN